jgi:predicted SnoaL-like aldol condensation-catalyzing enzyme/truncated hemoglobin YjbI
MKSYIISGALLLSAIGSAAGQATKKASKMAMLTNKETAHAINRAVMAGNVEAAAALVPDNYIQHAPNVPDGRSGLVAMVSKIKAGEMPAPSIRNLRIFEDGNYVVLHHDVDWAGKKAMFEIFRFEHGLAAEHWGAAAPQPERTANGHTMTDGTTEITDRHLTQQNKELVRNFVQAVLVEGRFGRILEYYHPQVIQHNPYISDSVEGLLRDVTALAQQGMTITFEKTHFVLGEGNFVLTLSEGKFAGKSTAFYDLFRVENSKIVEHWDVLQEVPEKMAHGNGLFKRSLYQRIGGYDGVAGFVDPRVAAHPDLAKYFIGHATDSKYRQRQMIVDKLAGTLGGPVVYTGRSLTSVHRGLNITAAEWGTFMGILTTAMDERGIRGEEKEEFVAVFQTAFRSLTVEAEIKD